jgi:hypothetical protein
MFRTSTPTLSPAHTTSISAYFTCDIVCPIKLTVANDFRFIQPLYRRNHAVEMRITAHAPPGASYFPFQQHIIIIPEICHFFFGKRILLDCPFGGD